MAGGTELFPDLGRHCAEETCHQLDFLPFRCDNCKKVFCLEHRTYKAHACPKANLKDNTVVICPLCEARVKTVFGEKPETTLKNHSSITGDCSPSLRVAKPRCPIKGCREVLTFSNRYHCKSCGKDVCLKHRYASSHCAQTVSTGSVCELNSLRASTSAQKTEAGLRKAEERLASLRVGKAY